MPSPVFTEERHSCEGLLSEANFHRSRENGTVPAAAGVINVGTIVKSDGAGGIIPAALNDTPVGIALYAIDATTAGGKIAYIARDAEWIGHQISFPAAVTTDADKRTMAGKLAALGIIARW